MRIQWQDRSKVERVEWQTRLSLRAVNWLFFLAWSVTGLTGSLRDERTAIALACVLVAVNVAQCLVADRHTRAALDQYLERGPVPRAITVTAGALTVVALGLIGALAATDSVKSGLIAMCVLFVPMPFAGVHALMVPVRRFVRQAAVAVVAALAVTAVVRPSPAGVVVVGAVFVLSAGISLMCYRCSAWTLSVMWESERAREVEARLAVAEERLRFGRDLHDVMGRNLAVVALKSELAVQLVRRGRTEDAVAQMTEVQRIAQESQKEVREVVRGYRGTDLRSELAGAHGVLGAAGIDCTVTGMPAGLPGEVQSALGWVVREATTNVLRHGDATRCSVDLSTGAQGIVLTVENDGVTGGCVNGRGSGLAGLRERLAAVGGTLESGVVDEEVFRVRASVPVAAAPAEGAAVPRAKEDAR